MKKYGVIVIGSGSALSLVYKAVSPKTKVALVAKEYLFPLRLEKIDTLILGCTHYPVLRAAIAGSVDPHVTLIDSGAAVAADVERALDERNLRNPSRQKPNLEFDVSDLPARFTEIGERFLGQTMGRVHRVPGF